MHYSGVEKGSSAALDAVGAFGAVDAAGGDEGASALRDGSVAGEAEIEAGAGGVVGGARTTNG